MEEIIQKIIWNSCLEASRQNQLVIDIDQDAITIERAKDNKFGDYSCGIAFKLKKSNKINPLEIATKLCDIVNNSDDSSHFESINVTNPGYINFTVSRNLLLNKISLILEENNNYGKGQSNESILIEYVSANPTGQLHIGHARNAVFGSCLANILSHAGYSVEQEFYINDTGQQIINLGNSLLKCYKKNYLNEIIAFGEDDYPEDLLLPYLNQIVEQNSFDDLDDVNLAKILAQHFMTAVIQDQKKQLEDINVKFNTWFSEKSLHDNNSITKTLEILKQKNLAYENEGALWIKSSNLGDERDRVLVKSTGLLTYLACDLAYHVNKFARGFKYVINIWGADHHGQVISLSCCLEALNQRGKDFSVILTQMVNLMRNGQPVRMSKRAGTVVTLKEVYDEVGSDAMRYFLIESSPNNTINFDLELAKKASSENPVFYIQYAHARLCSIIERATTDKKSLNIINDEVINLESLINKESINNDLFFDNQNYQSQKRIILKLIQFKSIINDCAKTRMPHKLAHYTYELAYDFHKFYENSKFIYLDDELLTLNRLILARAIKTVLSIALTILGITAPQKM